MRSYWQKYKEIFTILFLLVYPSSIDQLKLTIVVFCFFTSEERRGPWSLLYFSQRVRRGAFSWLQTAASLLDSTESYTLDFKGLWKLALLTMSVQKP